MHCNAESGSSFLLRIIQRKNEYTVTGVRTPDFRSQFKRDQRGPTASAQPSWHGDVLFPLGDIRNRKTLSRSRKTRLLQDFSGGSIVGVHVAVPIAAEHDTACGRKHSRIRRRGRALAPQYFPGLTIHRKKLAEISAGLGMFISARFTGPVPPLPAIFSTGP